MIPCFIQGRVGILMESLIGLALAVLQDLFCDFSFSSGCIVSASSGICVLVPCWARVGLSEILIINLEGTCFLRIWFKYCSIDFHWLSTDLTCASTQNCTKAFVSPLTFSQSTFFHWWTLCGSDFQMQASRLRSVTISTCSSAVEIPDTVSIDDNSESLLVKNKFNSDVNLVGSFCNWDRRDLDEILISLWLTHWLTCSLP